MCVRTDCQTETTVRFQSPAILNERSCVLNFPEIGFPPFHEAHRRCRKRCGVVSLWSCSTVLFVDESSTLSSTMNRECVAVAFVFPSLFLFRNVYLLPRGIDR